MTLTAISRRKWHQITGAALAAGAWLPAVGARAGPVAASKGCTLSIGTYSLKGISVEKSIELVHEIGFDGIEIAAQSGADGEPKEMSAQRRRNVRQLLSETGLKLTALMENLPLAEDDSRHTADLDRLRHVLALAHDLSPNQPPLVQTILGGGKWEEKKTLFRDRLADWVKVAEKARTVIAIKPHRSNAMSRPSEAAWLIDQLDGTPWLRMVYDYSHYAFRDMPLEETVKSALPYTAHIAVKDAVQEGNRVAFVLPGEAGTFDYARLLRLFYEGGYRGDVCCEVSSMVSSKPLYDPVSAAKTSYRNMAMAFERATIPRVNQGLRSRLFRTLIRSKGRVASPFESWQQQAHCLAFPWPT